MAIPGGQATHLERALAADARQVALWTGEDSPEPHWLCVALPEGPAWLACDRVQLTAIERSKMLQLNEVLRETMRGLPHVVGSAWTDEGYAWLVDLSRFGATAAS